MSAGRIIAYIGAAIFILFGVLFVLAAFSEQGAQAGPGNWILIGLILIAVGFGLIWLAGRAGRRAAEAQQIIQKIELSGDVNLEKMTCRSCGGTLTSENIKVIAGAPFVSCPYCNASYQLTEEPKW